MIEYDRLGLKRPGIEVVEKRTPSGKTFRIGGNKYNQRISPALLHYNNAGMLDDIDLAPECFPGFYLLRKAPYTLEISSGAPEIIYREGWREIALSLESIDGSTPKITETSCAHGNGHCLHYEGALGDGDLCLVITSTRIYTEQLIKSEAGIRTLKWKVRQNMAEPVVKETRVAGQDQNGKSAETNITRSRLLKSGNMWEHVFEERFTGNILEVADEKKRTLRPSRNVQYPVRIVS